VLESATAASEMNQFDWQDGSANILPELRIESTRALLIENQKIIFDEF